MSLGINRDILSNVNWTEHDIQKVRDISIAQQFGLPVGRRVSIQCPMPDHPADKTPSFMIYPDNSYHCFGCGVHGNNFIDFCTEIYKQKGVDEDKIFALIMKEYSNG
jgi:hypothetical protein